MNGCGNPPGRRRALGAGAGALAAALLAGCAEPSGRREPTAGLPGRAAPTSGASGRAAPTSGTSGRPAPASGASAPPTPGASGPARAPAPAPRRFPGLPVRIAHGPRDLPRVALTFDGRGDPDLALAALARCERAGARVTVLAVGTWLARHPELARRILDGGHELGNHTEHHLDLAALGESAAYEEIAACARRLRRLTGSVGAWFRPSPTTYASPLVERLARRAGYPHVLACDVESLDHAATRVASVTRKVAGELRNGSVVELSLGRPVTVAALPLLLAEIGRRGLHAVTATELMARPATGAARTAG
ncbi:MULTISPECIES: polysaccharide deacetylase family protein [unclassified Streptomyces]|uniref:polysaccharide deacetylase family protein n=1 Tax=Streptomyces TaxID=1883 RepID=UPI0015C47D5A|nr:MULTISPECIES: polysaccharide deacetylase family protein [unclassified Streptomyces]MBK0374268.1 polysaccharide deacetylase family protein [Streptomyces sp. RB110-1]MBK0389362.1 polysaccharide deacetylase family protein [Streptomyces sp. RB110-2]QLG31904.1 polysaccharide deacetylase family protein [Streptomyces sp. CB04723]